MLTIVMEVWEIVVYLDCISINTQDYGNVLQWMGSRIDLTGTADVTQAGSNAGARAGARIGAGELSCQVNLLPSLHWQAFLALITASANNVLDI